MKSPTVDWNSALEPWTQWLADDLLISSCWKMWKCRFSETVCLSIYLSTLCTYIYIYMYIYIYIYLSIHSIWYRCSPQICNVAMEYGENNQQKRQLCGSMGPVHPPAWSWGSKMDPARWRHWWAPERLQLGWFQGNVAGNDGFANNIWGVWMSPWTNSETSATYGFAHLRHGFLEAWSLPYPKCH